MAQSKRPRTAAAKTAKATPRINGIAVTADTRHHWQIREYQSHPGYLQYVNESTTSTEEGWTTTVPLDVQERARMQGVPTAPKQFATRSQAQPFFEAIRAQRRLADDKDFTVRPGRREQWKLVRIDEGQAAA